jgi:O-acetylserine/cysteine efflux transporter
VLLVLAPWLKAAPGQWTILVPAVLLFGAVHFALIFTGVKLSDASTMAIVNQLYVPISVILALFWLGETVPLQRWAGIALAFAGVVVFSLDAAVAAHWRGVLVLVVDGFAMGAGSVLLRKLSGVPAFVMQAWMAALGFPLLLLTSVLLERGQIAAAAQAPWQEWASLAFTVIGASLFGHTAYYYLLQRYEVSLVASVLLAAPVVGVLSGVLLLGEPFTAEIALGAAMTLAGVALVLIRQPLPALEAPDGA